MSYEREKNFKPINTIGELETMFEHWGGLETIIDPMVTRSGDTSGQRDALNHNNHVFPLFVELAKNELVDLEAEYNRRYLAEFEKLSDAICRQMNMTAAQKKNYVERKLCDSPESIGAQIKKYKNKIVKLEKVEQAQMNLLWTYNK